jgi:Trk-type K+ transport system membrane component
MPENILDDINVEIPKATRRRSLIPVWMKIFIWIFMIAGGMTIPVFILGIAGYNFDIALYGYSVHSETSWMGVLLALLFLYKGIVSFALWFEWELAVTLGIIDAIAGLLLCLIAMAHLSVLSEYTDSSAFRLEIVLLVPYLIKLIRIKKNWIRSDSMVTW